MKTLISIMAMMILLQWLLLYNARRVNQDCQAMLFSLMPYVQTVPPSGNLFDREDSP